MNGPGYTRAPVRAMPPSPPCAGTPLTATWFENPAMVKKVDELLAEPQQKQGVSVPL